MFHKRDSCFKKTMVMIFMMLMVGAVGACGSRADKAGDESQAGGTEGRLEISLDSDSDQTEAGEKAGGLEEAKESEAEGAKTGTATAEKGTAMAGEEGKAGKEGKTAAEENALREKFGEECIAGQTFEVELSEYEGKVWFVPYRPSESGQDFHMQIVQNGRILADINSYVPERLAGRQFESLDAVSFYDINYDSYTDIVLIVTYGGTSFAAVYDGFSREGEDYEQYFFSQDQLSEALSAQVQPLTISGIRDFVSGGKRNGSFAGWQEAYAAVGRLRELEKTAEVGYDLIYFDEDEIPELAAGVRGYEVSLYTYDNGTVYTLMDGWPYGAMGNAGYEYSPGKNSLRNYNSDQAGAVLYTTYMAVGKNHVLDRIVEIETYNFDDSNGNGILDEEESGSFGMYGVSYINGAEATNEECASYDAGGYEYIDPDMSWEQLREKLGS